VLDGDEPNPADDADEDGQPNIMDPDSDNDGLFDGTELGLGCDELDTDALQKHCVPDGDNGATKTNPLLADTDGGGTSDGLEDANLNGVVDSGETDPNDSTDDLVVECTTDSDCGETDSGKVCDNQVCVSGCRGTGGNTCPAEQVCSSTDDTIGECSTGGTGGGGAGGSEPEPTPGCGCRTAGSQDDTGALGLLALAGLATIAARRRRRR
ncbi:MAG: MYXO-CTERM sorting domain-containing protein, partial [Polyangiaceae bacterium]